MRWIASCFHSPFQQASLGADDSNQFLQPAAFGPEHASAAGSEPVVTPPRVVLSRRQAFPKLLDETCVKAGLPRGCWKDEDSDVFSFTAVVFGEDYAGASAVDDSDRAPKEPPGHPALPPR